VYEYDDGEGGYYASGSIEHNWKTGEIEVHYHDSENNVDVDDTYHSIGDAMKALRGGNSYPSWGGKKPNFDRLGQRKQHGPDDLRKTDRTGRKGTLAAGPANQLKQNIQVSKGKHGPKGVLPEDETVDEGILDTVKKVGSKVFDKLGGGSEEDLIKKLQKSAGVPQTGKKPEPKDKPVGEGLDDAEQADQKINTPAVQRKAAGGDWKVTTQDLAKADEKNMTSPAGMAALKKRMSTLEEEEVEESGLQAYLGNKKYGKDGMDALRKAGSEHASEKKMQNIRAKYSSKEEVAEDEFAGDYATGEAGQWRNKGPKANKPATIGDLVGEGEESNPLDPWKHVNPRVDNPKIKGTDKRAKSAYYPTPKPPVKKLDTPLTNETVIEGSDDLARILNIAGIKK
jgi:hypothetical protein